MYNLTYFKDCLVKQDNDHFEFKIGTQIIFEKYHKLEIQEQNGKTHCSGCVGLYFSPLCHCMTCLAEHRKDGKNVIVTEIETGENLKLK